MCHRDQIGVSHEDLAALRNGPKRQLRVSVLWGRDKSRFVRTSSLPHLHPIPISISIISFPIPIAIPSHLYAVVVLVGSKECIAIPRLNSEVSIEDSALIIGETRSCEIHRLVFVKNGETVLRYGVTNGETTVKLREAASVPSSNTHLPNLSIVLEAILALCMFSMALLMMWQYHDPLGIYAEESVIDVAELMHVSRLYHAVHEHARHDGALDSPYQKHLDTHMKRVLMKVETDLLAASLDAI